MFWRYGGYANISPINTLLDKPDVTVEEVLDESELLHEMKQHNTKLIEFIREDHVLKRMLEYIVSPSLLNNEDHYDNEDIKACGESKSSDRDLEKAVSGEGDVEPKSTVTQQLDGLGADLDPEELENAEKARLKYAYISSEVLSAPAWSIIEAMMLNEESLRIFWQFLHGTTPLDSLQSSYFYKVNEVLLDQKTPEMLSFVMSLDGIIETMLRHVDNPSVMDLLLKIISLDKPEAGLVVTEWLYSNNFIPILLSYISTEHSASTQTSAGDFLKALITISANAAQNEQPCIGPNSLTRQLVSEPCLRNLISIMLQGGNPLVVAVGIVIDVIRKNNPDYDPEPPEGRDATPSNHDPIYLGTLLRIFADHVPDFMKLILSSDRTVNEGGTYKVIERGRLSTAWGSKVEPLGFDRFKTCELMAELLHCSNMGLHNEIGSDEYMQIRESERERLRSLGAFSRQDEDSGLLYTENTNEFGNGISPSALGSGSPDEIRRIDSSNTGEEDGFEDVGSASVILEAKGIPENTNEQDTKSCVGTFTHVRKLGVRDDLVDEPLTPPRNEPSSTEKLPERPPPPSAGVSEQEGPTSPTSSGLTEKVQGFKFESINQNPTESQSSDQVTSALASNDTAQEVTCDQDQPSRPNHLPTPSPSPAAKVPPIAKNQKQEDGSNDYASCGQQLLSPSQREKFVQYIQEDSNGRPVVGDYLKIMFYKHNVLPTILALNGSMEQGFNQALVVNLFEEAEIPAQIVKGQRANDEAEAAKKTRLGYMGHLTLISEEVVKFTERLSPEALPKEIMKTVLHPDWVNFVENTLAETRERDNAILGGVKPDMSMGHRQAVLNAISGGQGLGTSSALTNAGLNGSIPSSGFDGLNFSNQGTVSGGVLGYGAGTASLFSGFGSSSDDEDEEMEDPEDLHRGFQNTNNDGLDSANGADGPTSRPISILPPPPPTSLSSGPSRARRQLAARLAAQKEAAEKAASASGKDASDAKNQNEVVPDGRPGFSNQMEDSSGTAPTSNPFLSADDDRDLDPNADLEFVSPFAMPGEGSSSPRHSFFSSFQPPSAYSSSSSDDDESIEAVQRNYRLPLEVYDDDDEVGDMVEPPTGFSSYSDDDDEETLIRETIGYSDFFGRERYANSTTLSSNNSGQHDNSDDEDEGLVEILVPGRRTPSN
ncbi:Sit4-associated protein [Coccidioides posadasii str. Silveira]|uniref:Sit4-associated protein n=1 Tax=Coccidioides posadasii (strain RMSCC 757 / Silveira) TaxID=443226 RepID=E9CW23_COCPS|nr:Sit4-associated protein [Coccidioides posadasii str. Silveira]